MVPPTPARGQGRRVCRTQRPARRAGLLRDSATAATAIATARPMPTTYVIDDDAPRPVAATSRVVGCASESTDRVTVDVVGRGVAVSVAAGDEPGTTMGRRISTDAVQRTQGVVVGRSAAQAVGRVLRLTGIADCRFEISD